MIKVKKFEAKDGKLFDTSIECLYYENRSALIEWIGKNIECREDEGVIYEDVENAIIADIEYLVQLTENINNYHPNRKSKLGEEAPEIGTFYWVKVSIEGYSEKDWFIGYCLGDMWKIWDKREMIPSFLITEIGGKINQIV